MRNVRVVGVDPSLTDTGVAELVLTPEDHWTLFTWSFKSSGRRGDGLRTRNERLRTLTANVKMYSEHADLIVLENPAYGSRVGSMHDRSGLWWSLVRSFLMAEIPVVTVEPTKLKLFATGSGRATKADMIGAASLNWGNYRLSSNDNVADAVHLATLGAALLDLPLPFTLTDEATRAIRGVELPDNWDEVQNNVA